MDNLNNQNPIVVEAPEDLGVFVPKAENTAFKTPFRPVYGTEIQIRNAPIFNGYIYFATDSGKMYTDIDGTRISLGSSSGVVIFYAEAEEVQQHPETYLYLIPKLSVNTSEGNPRENDLLLNSDGAFYKIISMDEINYNCTRIMVSGTGGGGGTSSVIDLRLDWDKDTIATGHTYIYNQKIEALFTPESDTDTYVSLSFDIINNETGEIIQVFKKQHLSGTVYKFDTSVLPLSNNITIKATVSADNSMMPDQKRTYTISSISTMKMEIQKLSEAYVPLVPATHASGILQLNYVPIGDATKTNIKMYLYVSIDGVLDNTYTTEIKPGTYNKSNTVGIQRQSHGSHIIELKLGTTINDQLYYSEPITFEGAWAGINDETPIIWVGSYDKTIINYENSYIKYMVYDPVADQNGLATTVYIYKDGKLLSEMNVKYSTADWLTLDISAIYEVGNNSFSLICRSATKNLDIYVTTEGSRDLGLAAQDALALSYTSAGRSNQEVKGTRGVWTAANAMTGYENAATLTKFNWQNNGWRNDGADADGVDNGTYLAIANDASVSFPVPSLKLNAGTDYSIETRFRIRNVQKYSTLIQTLATYFYIDPTTGLKSDQGALLSVIEDNGWELWKDGDGNTQTDNNNLVQNYETVDGVICKWMNSDNFGLCIGSQEAYFRNPDGIINVRYKEDEIINLTFVVSSTEKMVYIYLNGILSGADRLPTSADTGAFTIESAFNFNSNYCDVDLYRFRIYQYNLTMPEVIHNYLSDIHSIKLYDQNQLTEATTPTQLSYQMLLDYNKEHLDEPTMPYAVWKIIDGASREEKLPYFKGDEQLVEVTFVNAPLDRALDTGEIDEWYYYTHSPSFKAMNVDINVQGTSSQGYPRRNYKLKFKNAKETWTYTKGSLAGKPLTEKYKIKDKSGIEHTLAKKFHMDNENLGTNKFTWKIDYMESSGSYNTGFANLMGNLKYPLYTKHPLNDLKMDSEGYRTTVYGFPVLVFHEYDNATSNPNNKPAAGTTLYGDEKYEYIGRYNMNLDKGSNEYYGYELEDEHPFITNEDGSHPQIAEIAECWELSDNQGTWCSWRYPSAEARLKGFGTAQAGYEEGGADYRLEMIKHFEYRYSAYGDQIDAIGADGGYDGTTDDQEIIDQIGTTNAQKSAYLRERYHNLEVLFNWLDSTDTTTASNNTFSEPITLQSVKDYTSKYNYTQLLSGSKFDKTQSYYLKDEDSESYELFKRNTNGDISESDVDYETRFHDYCDDGRMFTREIDPEAEIKSIFNSSTNLYDTIFTKDSVEYRLEKFRNEFNDHLDKEYCIVYFILTELLLCYDSRGKNMMMASFGPHKNGGEYIWYPIFYDIDTQLGINNSGAPLWDYDADVSMDGIFSTATSVLWNNLFSVFEDDIKKKYRVLRGNSDGSIVVNKLTYSSISGAYACDPNFFDSYAMRGIRPIVAIGLDEYYKYFATTTKGYFDTSGSLIIESQPTFAYACQGDKKLTTELLLRNRLNYIDSWWQGGDYLLQQAIQGQFKARVSANNLKTSDKYLYRPVGESLTPEESELGFEVSHVYPVPYFDGRAGYKLKPFLKQYVTYFDDENPSLPVKYTASPEQADGVWTNIDTSVEDGFKSRKNTPNQQLNYIPGIDYLSSLGDLSTSYIDELYVYKGARLLDFTLGSDVPGYRNGLFKSGSAFNFEDTASSTGKKALLRKMILTNIPEFDQKVDITGSEKMQEFRALNTNLQAVNFASGAPLHTVHVPKTITELTLNEHKDLNRILTATPIVKYFDDSGILQENEPSTYQGLYVENITDYNSVNKDTGHTISSLIIRGGGLGYDSYTLLKNVINLKENAPSNNNLKIALEDISWTPYDQVESGEAPKINGNYFLLTDHSTYAPYTYTTLTDFNEKTLNGLLYTYNSNKDKSTITSLELLDKFIDIYLIAKQSGANSCQFSNINENLSIPTITGELFVANANADEGIIEDELTKKYKVYFPNLQITAEKIKEANITKYVQILESGKEEVIEILRTNDSHPSAPTAQIPTKANYDFLGWSLDKNSEEPFIAYDYENNVYTNLEEALESYTFTQNGEVLTLYAIFTIHKHKVEYYNGAELIETKYIAYNSPYEDSNTVPYRDASKLELTQKYKFMGYSQESSDTTKVTVAPPAKVMKDLTLYAVFEEASVYNDVLDSKYYIYNEVDNSISLSSNYILNGKITLPGKYQNQYINIISKLAVDGNNITHIFIEEDNKYIKIDQNCCESMTSLQYFELPKNLQRIEQRAFYKCTNLALDTITMIAKQSSSESARYIGANAFNQGLNFLNSIDSTLYISGNVNIIQSNAFSYLSYPPSTVQFGDINIKTSIEVENCGKPLFRHNPIDGLYEPITKIIFYVNDKNSSSRITELTTLVEENFGFRYPDQVDIEFRDGTESY